RLSPRQRPARGDRRSIGPLLRRPARHVGPGSCPPLAVALRTLAVAIRGSRTAHGDPGGTDARVTGHAELVPVEGVVAPEERADRVELERVHVTQRPKGCVT